MRTAVPTLIALSVALAVPALDLRSTAHAQAPITAGAPSLARINVVELASARRLWSSLAVRQSRAGVNDSVATWTDMSVTIEAVTGESLDEGVTLAAFESGMRAGAPLLTSAARNVGRRDADADRLLALGYSSREVADVLARRISQGALDRARRMLATGTDSQRVANFLDSQYRQTRIASQVHAARDDARSATASPTGTFDGLIARYAALHGVDVALVRAIIATESSFNPVARSPVGAIGLMQLMPGTARELGVNPFVPEQNIEGGVRYFSQLMRAFGRLDLALVAYNAGPGYAERYSKGLTSLYGETRQYVSRVLARLQGR